MQAKGNFIGGTWVAPAGQALTSRNPAADGAVVFEAGWNVESVDLAARTAAAAQPAWARLGFAARVAALAKFKEQIAARAGDLADAIVLETGKIRSEAKAEIQTLLNRFDLAKGAIEADLKEGAVPGAPSEKLRYHALGVVAVVGPFNFPLHLCHAHVIPALLTGNTVVVKPTELSPLSGQRYAEAAEAAGLPAGVFNLVQGTGAVGAALVQHPLVRGLCFTGSWGVGRKILEASLDRPELLVALEMGGKNMSIVLDDCALRQAVHEVAIGGYLSAGQRCTCTDRVLVHRKVAGPFLDALRKVAESLRYGHPDDPSVFAGPLVNEAARDKVERALEAAKKGGAQALVPGARIAGGSYRTASLHVLPDGVHHIPGYTDIEVFGPDLSVEIVDSDDEAIAVLRSSPYGFANAVFTASEERFDRIYRDTQSGILNRNRSTNLASPKLPFGGVGKSGNYRPAGAWAHRNTVAPVAVLENVLGAVAVHPHLAPLIPEPDLDRLETQHAGEERDEAARTLMSLPRPMAMHRPAGGRLPLSEKWLARLYAGDRVAKEKKPPVFDHLRSAGPWFVSIDDEPLSILDGMSQTATVCAGFGEDPVVRALVEGEFGDSLVRNDDTSLGETDAAAAYANTLRELVPGLPHVTFVASGAEANEKALALARANCPRPGATQVLAFEGSFHGRTYLSLHATWSPSKRAAFELPGYHATFAPFPVWDAPLPDDEPPAPSGFYAAAAAGDAADLMERFGDAKDDALLAAEVKSLCAVHEALKTGAYFACIVEPMQSEGGDRYATERFFRALRLLTRHHDTWMIFDEVQTGFGLGGPFAWHSRFRMHNRRGQPDWPDAVTFAKRAQVGVVMSRFDDPEPSSAHNASLVRGRIHADMMSTEHAAQRIEKLVRPRLDAIARAYPHLVLAPRAAGYAFAFDLPTTTHLDAFLGQRFWRGAIVFGAGTRTARYRLSESFLVREIDQLFDAIRRSLSWLDAHPDKKPPEWEDLGAGAAKPAVPDAAKIRFREVPQGADAMALLPAILDIEYQVYEPARRTPPAEIRAALEDAEGSTIVAETPDADGGGYTLIGFGLGAPLEHSKDVEGPDDDPMLGKHNTMYSVSITVAPGWQSTGIGRRIKEMQVQGAHARTRADGTPRYRYVTGRNRVGRTAQMTHLNRVFGAHVVQVLTGQYEDPEGQAIYYRIPLGAIAPDPAARQVPRPRTEEERTADHDLASGLTRVFATAPASLREAETSGLLYGPAVNKITLMNYATTGMIRALEWIGALVPDLPHMYLTSSRDEAFDKALRLFKCTRKQAQVAIGLDGGYLGHTVASARSLSDPAVHAGGPAHFAWPRVPHPAIAGTAATIAAIRAAVAAAGGPDKVFAFFYEIVQERTGLVLPADFGPALAALRKELDLPIAAVETTTSSYRSGHGAFASPSLGVVPDAMLWWGGGQTGYLHCQARWFIGTPLTLVSTWDGDELSLVRQHHQLRAARRLDVASASRALDDALARFGDRARGQGLYRVIDAGDRADALWSSLRERGVLLRRFKGGRLGVVPALDRAAADAAALGAALREVWAS